MYESNDSIDFSIENFNNKKDFKLDFTKSFSGKFDFY